MARTEAAGGKGGIGLDAQATDALPPSGEPDAVPSLPAFLLPRVDAKRTWVVLEELSDIVDLALVGDCKGESEARGCVSVLLAAGDARQGREGKRRTPAAVWLVVLDDILLGEDLELADGTLHCEEKERKERTG